MNTNLKTCPDCGKEVSKKVSVCPHCGRRETALGTMFLGLLMAALLIWFIVSLFHA